MCVLTFAGHICISCRAKTTTTVETFYCDLHTEKEVEMGTRNCRSMVLVPYIMVKVLTKWVIHLVL